MKKIFLAAFFSFFVFHNTLWAQNYGSVLKDSGTTALQQGFESYRKGDWTSAVLFLRKAQTMPELITEESLYILIMSEINSGDYKSAVADCSEFLSMYEYSLYSPVIIFHKGRLLHLLGENENAILILSDFCHENTHHALYPSALYWIAECFYAEYNFDTAKSLYLRVVNDFSSDGKAVDCKYRIEQINQRQREEKLLYLLKVTGEENLSSKEEYERQLRQYQTEDKLGLRKQLDEANLRIAELEKQLVNANRVKLNAEKNESTAVVDIVNEKSASHLIDGEKTADILLPDTGEKNMESVFEKNNTEYRDSDRFLSDAEVEALKQKARQLQYILEEQISGE